MQHYGANDLRQAKRIQLSPGFWQSLRGGVESNPAELVPEASLRRLTNDFPLPHKASWIISPLPSANHYRRNSLTAVYVAYRSSAKHIVSAVSG